LPLRHNRTTVAKSLVISWCTRMSHHLLFVDAPQQPTHPLHQLRVGLVFLGDKHAIAGCADHEAKVAWGEIEREPVNRLLADRTAQPAYR